MLTPIAPTSTSTDGISYTVANYAYEFLQNGPDGIALVAPNGTVIEFLSYESTFTAQDGPANGLLSIAIGVGESGLSLATSSVY
jgi:hypothetical protein